MATYKSATLDYVTYSKHTDWYICHPIMILSSFVFAAYRRTPFGFLNPTVTKPPNKAELGSSERTGIYVSSIGRTGYSGFLGRILIKVGRNTLTSLTS